MEDSEYPDIPQEVQEILVRLNQLSGNIGTSSRLDWTEQTLSIVGQLGHDPDAHDEDDAEFFLGFLDDQFQSAVIDEYDLPVIERTIEDGGFRYELDLSRYIEERPYILNIPFDDEIGGEPPERYKEYLEQDDSG